QKEKEKQGIEETLRQESLEVEAYKRFLEEQKMKPDMEKEYAGVRDEFDETEEKLKNKEVKKIEWSQRKISDGQLIGEKEAAFIHMEKEFERVTMVEPPDQGREGQNTGISQTTSPPVPEQLTFEHLTIEQLIHGYLEKKDMAEELKNRMDQSLLVIEAQGGSRFAMGQDFSAKILLLQEQTDKESIKNYKQALKKKQEARSRELGAMLKNLAKQLDLFKQEVMRFNNEMNKHKISNIHRIKFIVDEDNNILGTIKKLIFEDTLFGGSRHIDRVVENLNDIITRKGVSISLPNLFNLGVYLKLENGKEIESFGKGSIESTGTDLTIKVVLNVMLLSRILHVKQDHLLNIPAYIDEAGQIDPINQQTLIEQCAKAGFVPVFASVEAQSTADYWIGLKEVDGKIYVTQDDWFRLTPKPSEPLVN
ncbi:MAG: hypothetical protein DRH26_11310, partial [Deltaproteobacteria bacterium]